MKHRKRELLHNQRPHLLSSKLAGRLMSAMPMQGANQCNAHPKLLVRATEKSLAFSQIPSGWLPSQPPSRLYGFLVSTSASVQTETNCLLLQPLQWRELWLKRTPSAPKSLAPRHRRKKTGSRSSWFISDFPSCPFRLPSLSLLYSVSAVIRPQWWMLSAAMFFKTALPLSLQRSSFPGRAADCRCLYYLVFPRLHWVYWCSWHWYWCLFFNFDRLTF